MMLPYGMSDTTPALRLGKDLYLEQDGGRFGGLADGLLGWLGCLLSSQHQ